MKRYKVLNKNLTSPFKSFEYQIGKWYKCDDFDEDENNDCSRGYYATRIDGIPYSFSFKKSIYLVEVAGKSVEIDQYKMRYEKIKILKKCKKDDIIKRAKREEKRLGYKLSECIYPINPLEKTSKVSEIDIENLKKWASFRASFRASVGASVRNSIRASVGASVEASVRASFRASFRASVGASVWDSVWDSVRASVWAYISSLFPKIEKWKYIDHDIGINPYQPCIDLWHNNLVPSFDGRIWRLHAGKKAKIVYEMEAGE